MSKRKSPKKGDRAATGPVLSGSPMNVNLLEEIVKLMSANDLNTVEVRDGQRRVVLKRGAVAGSNAPVAIQHATAPTPALASGAANTPSAAVDETAGMISIKSPMVGTFYTAASPDAKPFVQVGSSLDPAPVQSNRADRIHTSRWRTR